MLLKRRQVEGIVFGDKADGSSLRTCAPGPADAVDIVFGIVGKLEVDDMGDAIDVNASPSGVVAMRYFSSPLLNLFRVDKRFFCGMSPASLHMKFGFSSEILLAHVYDPSDLQR